MSHMRYVLKKEGRFLSRAAWVFLLWFFVMGALI